MTQRPVAEGLFTTGDDPRLIGSRFTASGVVSFPISTTCPKSSTTEQEHVLLPREGTLWSWTIQGFLPKNPPYAGRETPLTFVPYGVGYVHLETGEGEGVLVESRLTENDPKKLKIGMPVELVLTPFTTDDDGTEVITFAFAPTTKEVAS